MMKETNIQPQVTSTIVGDDGEAMEKSEENAKEMASKKPNEGLKNLMMQDGTIARRQDLMQSKFVLKGSKEASLSWIESKRSLSDLQSRTTRAWVC